MRIVEYGVRKTYHLAVSFVGIEDIRPHCTDVLGETHHEFLSNGVNCGVGYLRKLLAEVVKEDLRAVTQGCQRCVVTHGGTGFRSIHTHRDDGAVDVFLAEVKSTQFSAEVRHVVVDFTSALQLFKLNTVRT